jgi:hypothetical protein
MAIEVKTVVQLTTGEEQFVRALTMGSRPCAAAVAAGYNICSASRLMAKPHIRAVLRACMANLTRALALAERRAAAVAD